MSSSELSEDELEDEERGEVKNRGVPTVCWRRICIRGVSYGGGSQEERRLDKLPVCSSGIMFLVMDLKWDPSVRFYSELSFTYVVNIQVNTIFWRMMMTVARECKKRLHLMWWSSMMTVVVHRTDNVKFTLITCERITRQPKFVRCNLYKHYKLLKCLVKTTWNR